MINKSETISELVKAVIKVMADVKGIEKNMEIGSGQNKYKGVADKDVKKIVGDSMAANGLAIFPIDITENAQLNEWDEIDEWSKQTPKPLKRKQSIFTKVLTSYLLLHDSGEFIELKGYGHGVDSQDKSAGKATTYALKYTLLYTFMIPTGTIDDADNTHSQDMPTKKIVDNTQRLVQAILLMEGQTTKDGLMKVWSDYKDLQNHVDFITCKDRMKLKFN